MHGLSAKLVVSDLKAKHLNEALDAEKKRKKRKRKIVEELRASDSSWTFIMSPSKI